MPVKPDVFISFKNLNKDGTQTRDCELAQEIHDFLVAQGLDVFFSNISLQKLGVSAYKKEIDNALDAAKILIAVGTSGENLDSQWVRYEWDSFFNDILSGIKPNGRIFAYVEGISITSLPRTLRQSQVFIHGPGAMERLLNFIVNILGKSAVDLDIKTTQIKSCLQRVLDTGEAWRTGSIESWLSQDTMKLISRIDVDWTTISPSVCHKLGDDGWPGTMTQRGLQKDKPRIWETNKIDNIADRILTVHRMIYPTDFIEKLVLQKFAAPVYKTPPWFEGHFMGGDLEITCKQCLYEDDNYDHYQDQAPPGECPNCGLGHRDWFTYNFNPTINNPGHDRTCKRCGFKIRVCSQQDDDSFPSYCPQCELGKNTSSNLIDMDSK
jgi:hypothetical protein